MPGSFPEPGFGQARQSSHDGQGSISTTGRSSQVSKRVDIAEELPSSERPLEKGDPGIGPALEASQAAGTEPSRVDGEQVVPESHQVDTGTVLQGPKLPASINTTPTQADYADYFRRGSSPTAIIPKYNSRHEKFERTNSGEQPALSQSKNDADTAPTLKSRYFTQASNQASNQIAPFYTDQTSTKLESLSTLPDELQRASEDSEGTFQTAKSRSAVDHALPTSLLHQHVENHDEEKPVEVQLRKSSGRSSRSVATPGAVPAANIRDQPTTRPFSFIQFSQSPAPQPLENYPHRQPSIDSTPSGVSSEHDVPPSPVSPQQPFFHDPVKREQAQRGDGQDLGFTNTKSTPRYSSHSFSRPFQESEHQSQSTSSGDRAPTVGDHMPAQHYPAPLPRQEVVIPRQQTTEYSLEGVGPPTKPRPTNSTSSSKRGSRSSALLKSFRNPPDNKAKGDSDGLDGSAIQDHPPIKKTGSKRGSLFRTLTGSVKANSSEDTLQKQRGIAPPVSIPKENQPVADTTEKYDFPVQSPSKYRNRLSRSSVSKVVEPPPQEPGKKKRFSAIGSLFGRSKDQKGPKVSPNSVPQALAAQEPRAGLGSPQKRDGRLSSILDDHIQAPPTERASSRDKQYRYTRDSLAKEGLLPQMTKRPSSRSPEPSAYSQTSAQHQQAFPPRHQSLSPGINGQNPRSPGWSRQSSATNVKPALPQQAALSDQRQRVQSSITTRSTTNPTGAQPTGPRPQHFSSTTTTTTTTSRAPNDRSRQQSLGNSFARSESPPPPPPPPKDTWHQPRQHQRSQSNISSTSMTRTSFEPPSQSASNRLIVPSQTYTTTAITTTNTPPQTSRDSRSPSIQPRQSPSPLPSHQTLPPLQTDISTSSSSAPAPAPNPNPRTTNTTTTATAAPLEPSEARKLRRSQIESMVVSPSTPRTEPTPTTANSATSDPEARKLRRSQIESMGMAPKGVEQQRQEHSSAPTTTTTTTYHTSTIPQMAPPSTTTNDKATTARAEAVPATASITPSAPASAPAAVDVLGRGRSPRAVVEHDDDEPIVMSATSFPGQMWQPSGYAWEGD
ncbi:MAG: hypothetical protein Q9220_001811 [cf. Caloplaca sp. 1 TL-2023]